MPWPMERFRHASTVINTLSSDGHETSYLFVMGGQGYNLQPLSDCWIINLDSVKWCQVI